MKKKIVHTRTRMTPCPSCGKPLDCATGVDGKSKPKFGDVSVCLYCGEILSFGMGLVLQPLTDEQMIEVAGDKRILAAQRLRGEVMKQKK